MQHDDGWRSFGTRPDHAVFKLLRTEIEHALICELRHLSPLLHRFRQIAAALFDRLTGRIKLGFRLRIIRRTRVENGREIGHRLATLSDIGRKSPCAVTRLICSLRLRLDHTVCALTQQQRISLR